MDIRDLIEAICEAHRQGVYNPPALRGTLTIAAPSFPCSRSRQATASRPASTPSEP